jgi:hypothetical protein
MYLSTLVALLFKPFIFHKNKTILLVILDSKYNKKNSEKKCNKSQLIIDDWGIKPT